ncbi:MAG: hypothetical protein M1814_000074 [Vezdaea aestivalis]|nr:MAG: hypothetical protein M1814_000074 [Vezdaea aestivalis]
MSQSPFSWSGACGSHSHTWHSEDLIVEPCQRNCFLCGKYFPDAARVRRHLKFHTDFNINLRPGKRGHPGVNVHTRLHGNAPVILQAKTSAGPINGNLSVPQSTTISLDLVASYSTQVEAEQAVIQIPANTTLLIQTLPSPLPAQLENQAPASSSKALRFSVVLSKATSPAKATGPSQWSRYCDMQSGKARAREDQESSQTISKSVANSLRVQTTDSSVHSSASTLSRPKVLSQWSRHYGIQKSTSQTHRNKALSHVVAGVQKYREKERSGRDTTDDQNLWGRRW